jgi:putative serine protease PepD
MPRKSEVVEEEPPAIVEPAVEQQTIAPPPLPPVHRTERRLWVAVSFLAALVVFGAGFGIAELTRSDTASSATTVASPTTTQAVIAGNTAATIPPGDEPVAAVAKALMPSVVQIESSTGVGAGFIYDPSGLILTAAHVVEGYSDVTVVLADGTRIPGTVVGYDSGSDVGVVRVDQPNLTAAPLAVGVQIEVGQTAIALGSPFGLDQTVTSGVVSAVDRSVQAPDGRVRAVLQTDAAINPGNSGGPLADREGRVIGINDFIVSPSGGNDGVGFAIPITTAKDVADRLVAGQPIGTGFLGVTGTDPQSGSPGALITDVLAGSPADQGGMQANDLVVSIDDRPIRSMDDLAADIQATTPGTEVTLGVQRGDQMVSLTIVVGSRPQ